MTPKRFRVTISNTNVVSFVDVVENKQLMSITFKNKSDAMDCKNALMYQCDLLNELNRLVGVNEEQCLAIMTYLHDNHYEVWEEVNKEVFGE